MLFLINLSYGLLKMFDDLRKQASDDQSSGGTGLPESTGVTSPEGGIRADDASQSADTSPEDSVIQAEGKELEGENDIKAMAGRLSKTEKEKNDLTRKVLELETQAQVLGVIDSVYAQDAGAYEEFRKAYQKKNRVDLGDYETRYGGQGSLQDSDNFKTDRTVSSPVDINQQVNQALEDREGFKQFVEAFPEMDPVKMTDPEKTKEAAKTWNEVQYLAASLKAVRTNLSSGDAFVSAYRTLHPEAQAKDIEQAKETGELTALHQMNVKNAASSGTITGAVGKTTPTVHFDDDDETVMKKLGIKDDAGRQIYAKYKMQ